MGGGPLDGKIALVGMCESCGDHPISDGSAVTHMVEGWTYVLREGQFHFEGRT